MSDLLLNTTDTFTFSQMTSYRPLKPEAARACALELARKRGAVFANARQRAGSGEAFGRGLVANMKRRAEAAKKRAAALKPKVKPAVPPVTGVGATRAFVSWITEARKSPERIDPRVLAQKRKQAIDAGADRHICKVLGVVAPVSALAKAAERDLIKQAMR